MFIFDTNVLSEILKLNPDNNVMGWVSSLVRPMIFTTTITKAELLYGFAILPKGKRKTGKENALRNIFEEDFRGRILNFDNDASNFFAEIASSRRSMGRPISQFDAMIAAITKSRGARLATRNTKDFEYCGIEVVNPWEFNV